MGNGRQPGEHTAASSHRRTAAVRHPDRARLAQGAAGTAPRFVGMNMGMDLQPRQPRLNR